MLGTHRRNRFIWTVLIIGAALWALPEVSEAKFSLQNWQNWMDDWNDWGSWGSASASGQDVFSYKWRGQNYTIENNIGSTSYVPKPPQENGQTVPNDWNNYGGNAPLWYEQPIVQDDPYSAYEYPVYDYGYNYDIAPQAYGGWYGDGYTDPYAGSFDGYVGIASDSVIIDDFVGYAQSTTLDCETRSAVDFAHFFGVEIGHDEFLAALPRSDDPNLGFVGDPNGFRGQLPPASYGVYEEPVAELLRYYGLNAVGINGMSLDALKAQVAAGRPVMVWVAGNTELGYPVDYTPSNGRTTQVVPYQHTVVVIGYDVNNVILQDGANRYYRSWNTFEASWGTLNNRAIYVAYE